MRATAVLVMGLVACKSHERPKVSASQHPVWPIYVWGTYRGTGDGRLVNELLAKPAPGGGTWPADDYRDPTAAALCELLYQLPTERRDRCCGDDTHDARQTDHYRRCAWILGYALRDQTITIAGADLAACRVDVEASHHGCDWVGNREVPIPPACLTAIHGALEEGDACQVSLECGRDLYCYDVNMYGPKWGHCARLRADGERCGVSMDLFSSSVGRGPFEEECIHHNCRANVCQPAVGAGGACFRSPQCAVGLQCVARRCVDHEPNLGEPCTDTCGDGSTCVGEICRRLGGNGAACASDIDCAEGGCVGGRCGMQCTVVRPVPP